VIIPARNEADLLPVLLASLRNDDSVPNEIIVVVGQCEDRTKEVAEGEGVTIIDSEPLPAGWVGKPWACYQGARLAKGDTLIFLDADTCIEKGGLRNIVDTYLETDGIVSVQPYHKTRRLYEQLSMFFNIIMMGAMGPFTVMGRLIRPIGLFGPCVVVKREYYFASGGHLAVKGEVVEDLALGERLKKHSLPIHCFGGQDTISFRMYPKGIRELIEGWSKGFATGARRAHIPLLVATIAWIGSGISATVCTVGAISSMQNTAIMWWALAYLAYAVQVQWMAFRVGTFRFYTALLFPVSLLFFITVFFRSILLVNIKKKVMWKGVAISLKDKAQKQ
ncbi:MAG TPA: glycosyltransferase, partial [Dehalococcoidia bacterium]|nr:glycosyltransferase [Dehalococcoidia bacterium]